MMFMKFKVYSVFMILRYILISVTCSAMVSGLTLACFGPPRPDLLPEIQEEEVPSLEQVVSDLKSQNPRTRAQAILELASRNERKFIPIGREWMRSSEEITKGPAILALGIWKDRTSLPEILNFLHPKSGIDIGTVLEAIARMEDPQAGNRVANLLNQEDSNIRLLAVDTLVRINARQSGKIILAFARSNKDTDKAKTFVMALGKLNVIEAEDYLIDLASHSEPGPTLAATYLALGKIRSKKSISLLVKALQADFDKGRENSTIALVDIKDPKILPLVLPILENQDKEIRYRAADVLIGVPDPGFSIRILEVLTKGKTLAKAPASHVLGRIKFSKAREEIEKTLLDSNIPDREIIAQSLGYLGDKKSIPVLVKVLQEDQTEARYGAVWALGAIGSEEGLPYVEEACKSKDQKLAKIASESLGMIASPKSISLLDKKTEDFPDLAPITLAAITSIPGEESRKILEKYAESENINLHQVAVSQLGAKKDPASVPVLIKLLQENSTSRNRKLIVSALRSVTGLKFASKNEWVNWYIVNFSKKHP
ncbi:HEAT repeat domain-containing protein [Leptospira selangorensis]|uniref:HEAT repeat domain-containing protein n=1 Tax=Leptospira selangorensis TaxID=2484982 RepID=A0A5F2C883_9LEPT|nr:HEAT repeat domain-containing protein [Leptospira selangorensis]TGM10820.1 HEAT repeat domain-containing protein [Leptospira selangorensis]TGM26855.1 HEAT repeat domain-containing protein [Leptospira selangorensis]